jgi:hypothetical protein
MFFCQLGPGCDVTAWRGFGAYYIRFGSALAEPDSDKRLETASLDVFAETLAALNRAGFRVPKFAFQRIDAAIAKAEAERRALAAAQMNLLELPQLAPAPVG